jgi:GAF domain-containing protein
MHEIAYLEDAPARARYCLEAAMRAVPCLAGLVHVLDGDSDDLVVVHAKGPRAEALLRARTPQRDPLVAETARVGRPTVVSYDGDSNPDANTCLRHTFFDPWSVALVPVLHDGRLLGLFELVDPLDGKPFDDGAQAALADIAARLGESLADLEGAEKPIPLVRATPRGTRVR